MNMADDRKKKSAEPAARRNRKGGNPFLGLLVIAITLALTAFSYHSYANNASLGRGKAFLHAAEAIGPSCVPLHIVVTRDESGILAVKASLRDLAGKEVAFQEKAFSGSQVSVDFLLVPAGKAGKDQGRLVLAFPRSIYSDVLPQGEGMRLLPSYAARSFPAVFDGSPAVASLAPAERKAVADAMKTLARADADPTGSSARSLSVQLCTVTLPAPSGSSGYDLEAKSNGEIIAKPVR